MGIFVLNFLRGILSAWATRCTNGLMIFDLVAVSSVFALRKDFCIPAGPRTEADRNTCSPACPVSLINVGITWHYMRLGTACRQCIRLLWWTVSESQGIGMIFGMGDPSIPGRPSWNRICPFSGSAGAAFLPPSSVPCVPRCRNRPMGCRNPACQNTAESCTVRIPVPILTLEDDKCLYFGRSVDGVIPYGTVGNTIIVNGDPVCREEDFPALLAEFREFCQNSAHNLFFLGLTDHFLAEYEKQGFGFCQMRRGSAFLPGGLRDQRQKGRENANEHQPCHESRCHRP